jgi:hypothetical protein
LARDALLECMDVSSQRLAAAYAPKAAVSGGRSTRGLLPPLTSSRRVRRRRSGPFTASVGRLLHRLSVGVYLQERRRLGRHPAAWHSTRETLRAMGLSILIELTATVLAAGAWLAVVLS